MDKLRNVILIILLLILLPIGSIYASNDLWLGIGFTADYDNIGNNFQQYYEGFHPDDPGKNISLIKRVGPSFEITYYLPFFPYLGFHAESRTLFPVGVNGDGYFMARGRSLSEKILLGLSGKIYFNDSYGFFLNVDGDITFNGNAKTINKNDKTPFVYAWYNTYGISGTLGLFANNDNQGFFRMGISYSHDLQSTQWNLGFTISGGWII